MRLIGTLNTLEYANLLSANLRVKKIEHFLEGGEIWVHNEDQMDEAIALFKRFEKNPSDPEFELPLSQTEPEPIVEEAAEKAELLVPRLVGHFTSVLIAFCALIYFLSAFQESSLIGKGVPHNVFVYTPIQEMLFFDVPPEIEKLDNMLKAYKLPEGEKQDLPLPTGIQEQIAVVQTAPFWRGISDIVLLKIKGEGTSLAEGPLFSKICHGEFWRLLTPIFLHGSILHIVFNMMWLWVLGRQVEQRVGVFRYILLTLLIGVFANVLQYLMSGPFFLGYSGVILGLAGFIWSRESIAPWEGYPLQKPMILFLGLYVLAMCFLQGVSIVLLLLSFPSFDPNIANTAHIAGAIFGLLLGRISFFAARPSI
jgi:GlpG protein